MSRAPLSREQWCVLDPLLDAALEICPDEREEWVDRACGGDSALAAELICAWIIRALWSKPGSAHFADYGPSRARAHSRARRRARRRARAHARRHSRSQ